MKELIQGIIILGVAFSLIPMAKHDNELAIYILTLFIFVIGTACLLTGLWDIISSPKHLSPKPRILGRDPNGKLLFKNQSMEK